MKRFHVHAHVEDLQASIVFYSKLFGAPPARVEADYAKWMLDDPRINFAISARGGKLGVDHLGIQADTEAELASMKSQAQAAEMSLQDTGVATCCYARSDKYWITDPQGIAWEQFHTLNGIPTFSEAAVSEPGSSACCPGGAPKGKPCAQAVAPAPKSSPSCC